jgi:TolA-binding protein
LPIAFALLLAATLLAVCAGCDSKATPSTAGSGTGIAPISEQTQYRNELLRSAVSLLNNPEQMDSNAQVEQQIVERLNQWRRLVHEANGELKSKSAAADAAASTNETAAKGDNAAESDEPTGGKEVTADEQHAMLLDTLPASLRQLRALRRLNDDVFDRAYDGSFLLEVALMRDVQNHINPEKLDDLSKAKAIFDWTIRNIQAEQPPGTDATPQDQWMALHTALETLYYGRGTPQQRAWVFALLARQAGLDVVLLGVPDTRNPDQPRFWAAALVNEGKASHDDVQHADSPKPVKQDLYLFDPAYGLPIPGPGGKGIATLTEAAADDAVLRQMDVPGDRIYPRKASDLKEVVVMLEASPGYLEPRMKAVEGQLTGSDRMFLSANPAALTEKVRGLKNVGQVKLWSFPYETLSARGSIPPPIQRAAFLEQVPFTIPALPEQKSKQQSDDSNQRTRLIRSLRLGRLLQLRGMFGSSDSQRPTSQQGLQLTEIEEHGAKYFLLRSLPTQEELAENARMQRDQPEIAKGVALAKELFEARQQERDDAAYWLGLIAFELQAYQTAAQYFGPMTLDAYPDGPWTNGARYNLARSLEAQGKLAEAIKLYEADKTPQRYGNRLRAERLKDAIAAQAAEKSSGGEAAKVDSKKDTQKANEPPVKKSADQPAKKSATSAPRSKP